MVEVMKGIGVGLVMVLVVAIVFALASLLLGWPTMLLWNWLMPAIFGLPEITFWQAVGLMLLSTLLVRSTSGGGSK